MAVVSREVERRSLAKDAQNAEGIPVFSIQRPGLRLTVKRQEGTAYPPKIIDGQNVRSHATMFAVFNQAGDVCGLLEGNITPINGELYYGLSNADNFQKGNSLYSGIMRDTIIDLLKQGVVDVVDSGYILFPNGRAMCEAIELLSRQPNSDFITQRILCPDYGEDEVQFIFKRIK